MVTWEKKRLGDGILKVGHGKSQHEIESSSGKYPILATGGIIGKSDSYLYDKPSVLIGRKGTIDRPQYMDKPFWTIDTLFYTLINEEQCAKYIYYLFCTINWNDYNEASGVPSLSSKVIENMEVTIPDKPEQHRIAAALSDTDALITALERLIAKKRAIKQGAMQELLTGKRRLPGFNGEWVEKKLGEVGIVTGSGVDKKVNEDEIPVTLLNYLDVYRYTYIKRSMLHQVVTAKREKLLQCNVQCGDVFFTPTSETADDIARTAVAIEDMDDVVYSYHVVRLRPFDGYNGVFIKYACDTVDFTEQTARLADGSGTRYIISLPNFREQLEIKIPPIHEEQSAIAEILSDMDAEIDKLTAKLSKLRGIKQGMMSELLTGRIRLIEQDATTNTENLNAVAGRED